MEESIDLQTSKPKMMPIAIKWGLILTFINVLISIITLMMNDWEYDANLNKSTPMMLLGIALPLTILFLGATEYKKANNNLLNFGTGFKVSYLISIFSLLTFTIYLFIFFNFMIDFDEYVNKTVSDTYAELQKKNLSKKEIDDRIKMTKMFVGSQALTIGMVVLGSLIMNAIYSVIVAAIAQKKEPSYS